MKNILKLVRNILFKHAEFIFVFAVIFFFIILSYRVEVFSLIKENYDQYQLLSFFTYMSTSLYYDSIILIYFIVIKYITFNIPRINFKTKIIITSVMMFLGFMIYQLAGEFFRVYQTTFQKTFITEEVTHDLWDSLSASLSEVSSVVYIKAVIAIIALFYLAGYILKTRDNFVLNKIKHIRLTPFILLVLFSIPTIFFNYEKMCKDEDAYLLKIANARSGGSLDEFSQNPLYNFFKTPKRKELKYNYTHINSKNFAFKLNTRSLVSDAIYPAKNLIPGGKKYNIIFYFFESFSSKYYNMKHKGKEVTPVWNRLMKNSFFAEKHYAHYPLSAKALYSVLASAYDLPDKDYIFMKYPKVKIKSMPEILQNQGYKTFLIHTHNLKYVSQIDFLRHRFQKILDLYDLQKLTDYGSLGWAIDDRAILKPTMDFIKSCNGNPYFITVTPFAPHHPYDVPEEKFRIFHYERGMKKRERVWINYLNSLNYADKVLGMLVDELEKNNQLDNTLLFIFSDHGEAFYQHPKNYIHALFLYEENVAIPFMIYNKKIFKKMVRFKGFTRHIDILPTVKDILGLKPEKTEEGISMFASRREQLVLLHTNWKDDFLGVRDGDWKYIYRVWDGYEELYNIKNDPDEKANLAKKHQDISIMYKKYLLNARRYKLQYYKRVIPNYKPNLK